MWGLCAEEACARPWRNRMVLPRRLPPIWLAALLATPIAACAPAPVCSLMGCNDGYSGRFPLHPEAPLQQLSVEVCRNGRCLTGTVVPQPVVGTGNGVRLGEHTEVSLFTLESGYRLHVSIYVRDPRDGDTYDVSAADQDGHPLLTSHEKVTYVAWQPNGSRCPPTCMRAKPQQNP
jgi:hypothetical protein